MKLTDLLKKSTAIAITMAIVGVMPGAEFYRAAAAPIATTAAPVGAATVAAPIVGVRGFGVSNVNAGAYRAPAAIGLSLGGARYKTHSMGGAVSATSDIAAESAVELAAQQAQSLAQSQAESRVEALSSLITETPELANLGSNEASVAVEADFNKKIGQSFRSYEAVPVAVAANYGTRRFTAPNGASKDVKKSSKMPDAGNGADLNGNNRGDDGSSRAMPDPDGSINPRRANNDGPDSRDDGSSNDRGGNGWGTAFSIALAVGSALAFLPVPALAAGMVAPQVLVVGSIAWFGVLMPSAILHEYAHGLTAHILGDNTPKNAGRLTLNPFKHISLMTTVLLPMALSLVGLPPVGAAKRMPVNPKNFKRPDLGMTLVSVMGPMTNIVLGLAGVGLFHGLMSMANPLAPLAAIAVLIGIRINFLLAFWNLVPVPGTDGGNILRSALDAMAAKNVPLAAGLRDVMDAVERHLERSMVSRLVLTAALMVGVLPFLADGSGFLMNWMLGLEGVGAHAAYASTPLMVASLGLSLFAGPMAASKVIALPSTPFTVLTSGASDASRAKIMVRIPTPAKWKNDFHVDWVDWNQPDAFEKYQTNVVAMAAQLERAGVPVSLLQEHDAVPVATYATLTRAATISVPAARKAELEAALRARGFTVEDPRVHTLGVMPNTADAPNAVASKTVYLRDVVKITGADKVQEILKKELAGAIDPTRLNVPGFLKPLTLRILKAVGLVKTPVNPAGSIIDTGNDPDHPMLKGRYVINGRDGHGHGTWVGSAVAAFDPEQKNLRSYNTFSNGSASTDDILRDLTKGFNDGAEWFTNSWGDSYGDPNALEAQSVRKIAEAGRIQFFAAGNQGSGDNTVGGPAIAYYKDPKTGTMTIVSVGATDSDGATAWFQSRGPWSPMVSGNQQKFPGYPVRVDIQSVGHKVYGAYPTYMRGADRNDPELGPQKESSGTSMSTPTMGGAYSLLREFGFEPVAIVAALLKTAKNTGKPEAEGGKGFVDVLAAYNALKADRDNSTGGKLRAFVSSRLAGVAAAVLVAVMAMPSVAMAGSGKVVGMSIGSAAVGAVVGFAAGFIAGMRATPYGRAGSIDLAPVIWVFWGVVGAGIGGTTGAILGAYLGS